MSNSATPGWYHAEGDPPGTERFWDGAAWTEGPRPVGGIADAPATPAPGTDMPTMGVETPPAETPGGFTSETPGGFSTETPGGFSTETPGGFTSETPGGFGTETPGGFPAQSPSVGAGGFGAPAPGTPQDGFGVPPVGMPPATGPGGFPGAPAGMPGSAAGFYPEESKATTALVVAILGTVLCGPPGIIGAIMGNSERKAIAEGRRDPAGQGKATAAIVIGSIAAILTVLFVIAVIAVIALGSTA